MTQFIDLTGEPPINEGLGGLGLGVPWQPTNQAIQNDVGSIPQAAAAAGIPDVSIPASTTQANAPASITDASALSSWFARGAIVILGFVFVAVGLGEFR